MQEFFFSLLHAVTIQILGVLGIFFIFGFLLSKIQEATHSRYRRTIGWKGILWTAWIGTPIHELGHVFFAILFRHRINKISLFEPNERTGGLGYVNHSFGKYNLWQRIGNFFIGAAPMIFGSVFLYLMLYFLVPNGKEVLVTLSIEQNSIQAIFYSLTETLSGLFSLENIKSWNFWVFLYLSFCITSHLAPSKQDRRGMWQGFAWVVLMLIVTNAITLALGSNITDYILGINKYLGILMAIFSYALIVSALHYLLATIILLPFGRK
jgi:hypothetical protein